MSARSFSTAAASPSPSSSRPFASPFQQQTRGSSSLASPSLSFSSAAKSAPPAKTQLHPLKYSWDVWFSQRAAGTKNKKDETKAGAGGKEKDSREDWQGGVVKLGGFSSIESLHPFLAHLVPPSALPSSLHSSATIFRPSETAPSQSNLIHDYNVFRSSIAPAWEDAANVNGGRWVIRLRKGVADRVWEEAVYALVSERIGTDGGSEKVNGVVLSVRKEEDILSIWVAQSSRAERDAIRDSIRLALEPLLTPTSLSALAIDYKPHPVTSSSLGLSHTTSTPGSSRLHDLSSPSYLTGDSPSPRRRFGSPTPGSGEREPGTPLSKTRSGAGEGRGFGNYISRTASEGGFGRASSPSASPVGVIGSGTGAFGRPRLGQRSESLRGEVRASPNGSGEEKGRNGSSGGAGSWGRA
ncbi:hypothetical protein JCM11641_005141 [Rhodosporidiobolus odoratus]